MLKFPGGLAPETFLARYWQKSHLLMGTAATPLRPSVSRNELAWLATLADVESRIVFTTRHAGRRRYRVENGPFDPAYLQSLPRRDWSLLVHDVDKHLPAMRKLFALVPFVPDWRIDDLMISFATPGGGVGPHRDNYDVFLCQGIGLREWRISAAEPAEDATASDDLVLLEEFPADSSYRMSAGDVLYLPPGVPHWGIAERACMTYSIGMRAPAGYADPDLQPDEVRPGYISPAALTRAGRQRHTLGCQVTELKEWLRPIPPTDSEITALLEQHAPPHPVRVHGMARIAYDDDRLYVNGSARDLRASDKPAVTAMCRQRRLTRNHAASLGVPCLRWLLAQGAFDTTDIM